METFQTDLRTLAARALKRTGLKAGRILRDKPTNQTKKTKDKKPLNIENKLAAARREVDWEKGEKRGLRVHLSPWALPNV